MLNDEKHEEAYALLSMVMDKASHVVPIAAVIEWWLETNKPPSVLEEEREAAAA